MTPTSSKMAPSPKALKLLPVTVGLILVAAFFSLTETYQGLSIIIGPPFTRSSRGELYFWLGHSIFITMGTGLIGYGLSPWLGNVLAGAQRRILALTGRQVALSVLLVGVFSLAVAWLGRTYFLMNLPLTDDEMAARFGGQVLASGAFEIDTPPLATRLPHTFLYSDGVGHIASLDWLGVQIAWALAEVTHLGSIVFTFLAALPVLLIGLLVGRRTGRVYGVAAMAILLLSPMAFSLSMTTHAHVVSRALLAAFLYVSFVARNKKKVWLWIMSGLCLGGGLLTRPIETAALLAPLALWHLVQGPRGNKSLWQGGMWMLVGLLPAIALFLVQNGQVTGSPFLPARWDAPAGANTPELLAGSTALLWHRFGINTSYNLLMLAIWFLGPLGCVLVIAGAKSSMFCKLLGLGVALSLLVGLFHEDSGLHAIGPIHYSEAVIPLTIIAVGGLARLRKFFSRMDASLRPWVSILVVTTVLSCGFFSVWNGLALRRSARFQKQIYSIVEDPALPRSVVLVPYFGKVWMEIPSYRSIGGWVYGWRHAHPDLRDRVLFVDDRPGKDDAVRKAFPDRALYRLEYLTERPYLHLVEVN